MTVELQNFLDDKKHFEMILNNEDSYLSKHIRDISFNIKEMTEFSVFNYLYFLILKNKNNKIKYNNKISNIIDLVDFNSFIKYIFNDFENLDSTLFLSNEIVLKNIKKEEFKSLKRWVLMSVTKKSYLMNSNNALNLLFNDKEKSLMVFSRSELNDFRHYIRKTSNTALFNYKELERVYKKSFMIIKKDIVPFSDEYHQAICTYPFFYDKEETNQYIKNQLSLIRIVFKKIKDNEKDYKKNIEEIKILKGSSYFDINTLKEFNNEKEEKDNIKKQLMKIFNEVLCKSHFKESICSYMEGLKPQKTDSYSPYYMSVNSYYENENIFIRKANFEILELIENSISYESMSKNRTKKEALILLLKINKNESKETFIKKIDIFFGDKFPFLTEKKFSLNLISFLDENLFLKLINDFNIVKEKENFLNELFIEILFFIFMNSDNDMKITRNDYDILILNYKK